METTTAPTTNESLVKPDCGCPADRPCSFSGFGHTDHAVSGVSLEAPSSLAKAVEYLGAVEVAPGRYAWKDADGWNVAREKGCACGFGYGLGELGRVDSIEDTIPAQAHAVEMPSWWSPSQRFAWRVIYIEDALPNEIVPDEAEVQVRMGEATVAHYERITADLTTGGEIPA